MTQVSSQSGTVLRFHLGRSFNQYFSVEGEEVTTYELYTYTSIFQSPIIGTHAQEAYQAASEMHVYHLLIESAFSIRQCLGNTVSYSLYAAIQYRLSSRLDIIF